MQFCPHCFNKLIPWEEESFSVEPTGFDETYSVCCNNDCSYYKDGFKTVGSYFSVAQGVLSHRYMIDKEGNELSVLSSIYDTRHTENELTEKYLNKEIDFGVSDYSLDDSRYDGCICAVNHYEVTNPSYYTKGKIECIDYILDKGLDFLEGNVVKYITRWKEKGGVDDLEKAKWYIERLIRREVG